MQKPDSVGNGFSVWLTVRPWRTECRTDPLRSLHNRITKTRPRSPATAINLGLLYHDWLRIGKPIRAEGTGLLVARDEGRKLLKTGRKTVEISKGCGPQSNLGAGLKVVRFVAFGGGTEQLAQKVLSQKVRQISRDGTVGRKNGSNPWNYRDGGDLLPLRGGGGTWAVSHWGWPLVFLQPPGRGPQSCPTPNGAGSYQPLVCSLQWR